VHTVVELSYWCRDIPLGLCWHYLVRVCELRLTSCHLRTCLATCFCLRFTFRRGFSSPSRFSHPVRVGHFSLDVPFNALSKYFVYKFLITWGKYRVKFTKQFTVFQISVFIYYKNMIQIKVRRCYKKFRRNDSD
jgi:hypothetical protein